jgi:putative DNA primase/helicase
MSEAIDAIRFEAEKTIRMKNTPINDTNQIKQVILYYMLEGKKAPKYVMEEIWERYSGEELPDEKIDQLYSDATEAFKVLKNLQHEEFKNIAPDLPKITEISVAERFVKELNGDYLFNCSTKKWHVWNGKCWQVDGRNIVLEKARSFVKTLYKDVGEVEVMDIGSYIHDIKKINTKTGVLNITTLAGIQLTRTSEDFDKNMHLLNVQNGTLDFTDGTIKFREHKKEDMNSLICGCDYDPDAKIPEIWLNHIKTMTCDDADLASNLQEILGYTLDGGNRHEYFLVLHGGGRNGKSVTTRVLQYILGNYSVTVNPLTLMEHGNKTVSPERIKMMNKRFILAQEPNKQDDDLKNGNTATLDAGFIKSASGKDFINARELYSNDVQKFKVTGLITFSTNPLPKIKDNTVAFWERIITFPFRFIIPDWQRDTEIESKFENAGPGILNWLLAGLQRTMQSRIKLCKVIKEDIAEYRLTVDEYSLFCAACIEESLAGAVAEVSSKELHKAYVAYQSSNGATPQNETVFGIEMKKRFNTKRFPSGIRYIGIKLHDAQTKI